MVKSGLYFFLFWNWTSTFRDTCYPVRPIQLWHQLFRGRTTILLLPGFPLNTPLDEASLLSSCQHVERSTTTSNARTHYTSRLVACLSLIFILKFKRWSLFIYFYEIFHEIQYYGAHSEYNTFHCPWLCFPNTNWKCIYYYYTRFQRLHTGPCLRMASTHFITSSSMWLQRKFYIPYSREH